MGPMFQSVGPSHLAWNRLGDVKRKGEGEKTEEGLERTRLVCAAGGPVTLSL